MIYGRQGKDLLLEHRGAEESEKNCHDLNQLVLLLYFILVASSLDNFVTSHDCLRSDRNYIGELRPNSDGWSGLLSQTTILIHQM
ncbi:hypothetical protein TcasGA2_TC033351 [Tribolium castaneum]|uniref:Uncharacterized protein n=1 Tax=Tribolium castaneum TaxID=7070 RepID=A0A139WGS3_TRICA|nr:hypothetical protein TcasGA2_TC033351 [Tribolium castaneum]